MQSKNFTHQEYIIRHIKLSTAHRTVLSNDIVHVTIILKPQAMRARNTSTLNVIIKALKELVKLFLIHETLLTALERSIDLVPIMLSVPGLNA